MEHTIPYLNEWLGAWAIEPTFGSQLADAVRNLDIASHLATVDAVSLGSTGSDEYAYRTRVTDGVAVIDLQGTLMKHASSFGGGTSTVLARKAIAKASNDPDIRSIVLNIDSPGGTVNGTKELADAVQNARKNKPVYASVTDLCASAAYWVASQCDSVYASEMSLVGSIGTYMAISDYSGMAAMKGLKTHVVRAGAFKGAATPGTEITADHLADFQRLIDDRNEHFLKAVETGRSMTRDHLSSIADGRVHPVADAKKLGLIDGVATLDEVVAKARKSQKVRTKMIADIKQACPGASDSFLVSALEKGLSVDDAKTAWLAQQQSIIAARDARIAALETELAQAKEELAKAVATPAAKPVASVGAKPITASTETEKPSSAKAEFASRVAAMVESGKYTPHHARQQVMTDNDLRVRLLAEING